MTGKSSDTISRIYISRDQLLGLRHEQAQSIARQTWRHNSNVAGEILSSIKGHGIEFTDIRPYQPGDEVRHIDWRTTARTGSPYTREYNEERQQTIYLAVDQRINMFFGSTSEFKSVTSARLAGIIAWGAVSRGFRLGATVIGTISSELTNDTSAASTGTAGRVDQRHHLSTVRNGPSKQTTLKLINELTLANNALSARCPVDNYAAEGLDKLLRQTLTHRQSGSTIYLISDFHGFNADHSRLLIALGKKCHIVMILISDRLEEQLPESGTIGVSDGALRRAIKITANRRMHYKQQRQRFLNELKSSADRSSARLVHHVSTESSTS